MALVKDEIEGSETRLLKGSGLQSLTTRLRSALQQLLLIGSVHSSTTRRLCSSKVGQSFCERLAASHTVDKTTSELEIEETAELQTLLLPSPGGFRSRAAAQRVAPGRQTLVAMRASNES